jgi:hypothetical protein
VIDKSGGSTYIESNQVDSNYAEIGQSVKIGGTVLKIERRRRPLED